MKKLLLATAAFALIAPAAQAEVKLDLGGYFKGYAGYADQDVDTKDFDLKRRSQIFFTGETTLDNGLTVGYNGSLFQETNDSANVPALGANGDTQIERSYLYFSGNWGRVNLGRENGAAYLLQVSAPGADSNLDGQDVSFSFYNAGAAVRQDYKHTVLGEQYADKVSYLTPKFNGFQAGVTYTPTVEQKMVNDNFNGMPARVGGTHSYEDLMEVGARYDGEFSGVGMHLGAGYSTADANVAADDLDTWNVGAKFTVDAFGFGANYLDDEQNGLDMRTWVAGVDYTYGAYTFGASYFNTKEKNIDAKMDRWMVGAGYTFGPGMKFNGAVALYDANTAANGNDATVVTVGTDIQF